jgi:DNA-binding NtrC family response regulator
MLSQHLLESLLFGHMRSNCWGPGPDSLLRPGLLEVSSGGTLLLADIDEIHPITLGGVARALREKRVRPIGHDQYRDVDLRIIATTNPARLDQHGPSPFPSSELEGVVVVTVAVPSLRERADDIEMLADELAREISVEHGAEIPPLSRKAIDQLKAYDWPGNIRELRNVIERAMLLGGGKELDFSDYMTSRARTRRQSSA